jgi:cysteine desulfurase/selenocysteine lyase
MTTPDATAAAPGGADASSPSELRLATAYLPTVGEPPSLPAAGSSTPGLAGAVVRHPGAPTGPDFDPVSLTTLVSRLANEMFTAPPAVAPGALAAAPSPVAPGAPTLGGAPPGSLPATSLSPEYAARSPFDGPLNFDFLGAAGAPPSADPFASMLGAERFEIPLLDQHPQHPQHAPHAPEAPQAPDAPQAPEAPHAPATRAPELGAFHYEVVPTSDASVRSLGQNQGSRAIFDPHALKREFPILGETVHGKPLVWLDNAATTQKPKTVIDRLSYFYEHENSNIHRAAHTLAARATDAYETARGSVRRFLNAPQSRDIIFVRGATEGINLIAQSWGRRNVNAGDEIVISWLEHHANIVPWQMLCTARGAKLRVAPVDDRGQIILEEYEKLLSPKTRLVSFTQVSNALGTITPAEEMVAMAHRHGARVLVDGAQAVSHKPVDVQALGCDFYVFSGHKVFGPTGIGAVYGRAEELEAMPPWQGGGNMIEDVTFERTRYQPPPARFEAGTGNIADAVGLGAALDWLTRVGVERVERYEHELLEYATERLLRVPGLTMIGTAPAKAGVLSFVLAGQKTEEVGGMLDKEGIAVRSGHHCAQPILRRFGVEATVRASLAPYNTTEDIDHLEAALRRIQAGHVAR